MSELRVFGNKKHIVLFMTMEGQVVEVSKPACDFYGYTRQEFLTLRLQDLCKQVSGEELHRALINALFREVIFETEHYQKDGTAFPVEVSLQHMVWEGKDYLIGIITNIRLRKLFRERLRNLSMAVEQSPSSVVITDAKGRIQYVNSKFCQLTGYSWDEVIGKNTNILRSGAQSSEFYKDMWATLIRGDEWQGKFHNKKKNNEYYWELASISPIKNSEGAITHFVAVKEDITALEAAESALRWREAEMRKQLEMAGALQKGILPEAVCNSHFTVRTLYEPANLVSGDMYDYVWQEKQTCLVGYVADVMGHGVGAALQTSALRVLGRQTITGDGSLSEKVTQLNDDITPYLEKDSFAALMVFQFDFSANLLTYVSAGINYFLVLSPSLSGVVKVPGIFVGMLPNMSYEQHTIPFYPGDSFFFLSDGMFELLTEEIIEKMNDYETAMKLMEELIRVQRRRDDATVVGIRIK